jgi:DNA-binding response OmpR family regulator
MRILLIEDERQLAAVIKRGLQEEGYAVDATFDGDEGQYYAENTAYDLIILDVMLPKKNGLDVCRDLRMIKVYTPILMLTARDKVRDKVDGLDCGADDYMVKPFAFPELLARIRAIRRREEGNKNPLISIGDLTLDPASRIVKKKGREIPFTTKEFAMLEFFMRNPGTMLTRGALEQHVWDYEFDSGSNIVDVYVRRIRNKIGAAGRRGPIETVRGAGYRMRNE